MLRCRQSIGSGVQGHLRVADLKDTKYYQWMLVNLPDRERMSELQPSVLVVTDKCDLAETQLILGLHRAGIDLRVACNPEGPNFRALEEAGIVAARIRLQGRFDKEGTATLRRLLDERETDVIHCFNPRALACSLRASRGRKVAVVAYRGVIGNVSFLNPESWLTFLNPRLNRIVCVSDAVKAYFENLRFLWWRLPAQRLTRIYKGHDLAWYTAPAADLGEFGFPPEAFVFCCIGRDRPGKGFRTLIEAMDLIPDESPVHLLLVGDLKGNAELKAQIEQCRHAGRIRLAGFRKNAPQIAAACDAMVLPSESEGLPRVVIEAMAYQRPVVVTEAGGMPELVRDGQEGLVVPVRAPQALANAMSRLADDPDKAASMGRRGQRRIEEAFHARTTVRETAELYQELKAELTS
ncbi:MAG: glycosyltransferase family 4 protein [Marinobacter sp.]|uniref:glycosyltransferase family 4 protein n=1 Tax=Marinobacter sp. TaxID=50741 RepID=UPI00299CF6A7|nr:glycosyltransferase family 4 protein [Marinobacter sp.]MDX1634990.1 glycosyltransferase family 4 protein [Marinobacter sp.]